jgi:folate-dependent phosphoribosylglycinamide formyltransferase PurN
MNIVILTNDNFFSFTVLRRFLALRRDQIRLIVFSSALIGKRSTTASIKWSLANTGYCHTAFKLSVYGIFRAMRLICKLLPFIPNHYSSYLWARRNNIERVASADINATETVNAIKKADPDLIVSVSMNQIVKKEILDLPPNRCINVHCAPLPRYAGMSPYVWALANGEDHSAATIHYMDEGLDTGDIVVQEKVGVVEHDSAFALFYRCCRRASELLIKVVDDIEAGTVRSYPQDLSKKSYFSWPTRQCVKSLHRNGYRLAKIGDFISAVCKHRPRIE